MRTLGKIVASLAVVGVLALTASAQEKVQVQFNRIGAGIGGGQLMLLDQKDVQDDLKLTEEQAGKIKGLAEKQRQAYKDLPQDKDERLKKIQEIAKENQEREKAASDLLKPEQAKRLGQIQMQMRGVGAFFDPKVGESLQLTDEQKDKIKSIVQESSKDQQEIFKDAKNNPEEFQKKLAEQRTKTLEKITAALKDEQKTKWKDLTGEPFKGKLPGYGGFFPGARPLNKPVDKPQPIQLDPAPKTIK